MILRYLYKICLLILSLTPFISTAQKLPNIQTIAILLPADVKIDGKLTEWQGALSAYNKSTRLFYTLANDDKNIYLAVKSTDRATIGKIMAGGIDIIMNIQGKNQKDAIEIVYPLNNPKYLSYAYLDSIKIKDMVTQAKELKIINIKAIADSVLSIYNSQGIKTALTYYKGELIYELMLPFNLLGISLNNPRFNYTLKLEGSFKAERKINALSSVPAPPMGMPSNRSPLSDAGLIFEMRTPTYFSASYILKL